MFPALFEDEHFIAIDKPPGFHVHPPENGLWKVPRSKICLYLVRDQLKNYVYPIHRLDAATGGVLIFGKSSVAASQMQTLIKNQTIEKKYLAVIRGHIEESLVIDRPLKSDSSDQLLPSQTLIKRCGQIELPFAVGKRHASARYSLIDVEPKTGRFHQIRRHCAAQAHPIIGDIMHGDSYHNRFFRETMAIPGLLLHSYQLTFKHPFTEQELTIKTDWSDRWKKVFEVFQLSKVFEDSSQGS